MTTAAVSKFSALSTKLQVGTAAVAVAAAAAITPAVAHATPTLSPFAEGLGNSAELLIDPVVIAPTPGTPGSNKKAAASETPAGTIIQVFISGFVDSAGNALLAGAQFLGTWVYGGLAFTGLGFQLAGGVFPGPIGDALTNVGNSLDDAAWSVAKAIKIGPYSSSI
jgi:hypothetical protein